MFGPKMKSAFYAAATASALVVGMSPAMADPVILNPLAPNGSLGALSANGADTAFPATQANLVFTSDLRINSAVNAGGSVGVSEVGSFLFTSWGGAFASNGLGTDYNIYGTFSFTGGTGVWDSNGGFQQTTAGTGTVTLFANPKCAFGTACAPTFQQSTQGPLVLGYTSNSALDFILASATVTGFNGSLPFATFAGFETSLPPGTVLNGQGLGANLALVPAAGTSGVGGFWQNVLPTGFNLTVTASNTANGQAITELANQTGGFDGCPVTTCSVLRTHAVFGVNGSNGQGSVTFAVTSVPEPATLVLFGAGLLGLGFMLRRRNESANKA